MTGDWLLSNQRLITCSSELNQPQFGFPGDEVLQWNGKSLPGATKKEVYNIILESKAEPQVEIVVSRPIG